MTARGSFYETVDVRQSGLDQWLGHDHPERPLPGCGNPGMRPIANATPLRPAGLSRCA